MSQSEAVSIVIPARDSGEWLRSAIESCLGQTKPPDEIIVVDDGSTDDTAAKAMAFGDRVNLLCQTAQGGNVARNTGLAAATGKWVQFLDADDYLQPNKISQQLSEAADNANADVLYSPVLVETWRDGKPGLLEPTAIDLSTDIFTQWINWQLPQTGGALWRRSALIDLGGWKEGQPCCQEHELYLRSLQHGHRWIHCPSSGAVYRLWSEETVCRRDPIQVVREKTKLLDALMKWLKTTNQWQPQHQVAAGQACFEMARTWARSDLKEASRYADERMSLNCFAAIGPAAPLRYRMILKTCGFTLAETFARLSRKSVPSSP